jgi:endonuclease/exonuclease/phosphatase family metal-dependent hydrolase
MPPVPPRSPGHVRLMTLNAAHGRQTATHQALLTRDTMQRNLRDIADTLVEVEPDVVALQEADGPSAWSGNFDHVAMLSELANLPSHTRGNHNPFGMGRFDLASGTALLARHPLEGPASHRFGTFGADTKGFVLATVTLPYAGGVPVDVVSVHLDFAVPRLRRKQIHTMLDVLEPRENPIVVLGDLNCCWNRDPRTMELLSRPLGLRAHRAFAHVPTFPSHRPRHRLDWILASEELEFRGYHTVPVRISDHLGVVADLELRSGARRRRGG